MLIRVLIDNTSHAPTSTYFPETFSNGPSSGHSFPLLSRNFFWNDCCAFSSDVLYDSSAH